jgi:hypothetical protein
VVIEAGVVVIEVDVTTWELQIVIVVARLVKDLAASMLKELRTRVVREIVTTVMREIVTREIETSLEPCLPCIHGHKPTIQHSNKTETQLQSKKRK